LIGVAAKKEVTEPRVASGEVEVFTPYHSGAP